MEASLYIGRGYSKVSEPIDGSRKPANRAGMKTAIKFRMTLLTLSVVLDEKYNDNKEKIKVIKYGNILLCFYAKIYDNFFSKSLL